MSTGARARVQIADADVTGIAVANGVVVIEARRRSVVLDERVVRRALAVIEADWALHAFADEGADALDGSGL